MTITTSGQPIFICIQISFILERQDDKISKAKEELQTLGMDGHGWTVILALIIERLSDRDIWLALEDQGRSKSSIQNLKSIVFLIQDLRLLFEILPLSSLSNSTWQVVHCTPLTSTSRRAEALECTKGAAIQIIFSSTICSHCLEIEYRITSL